MEKKLPSVFVNNAAKKITSNNKSIFYSNSKFQTETILQRDSGSKKFLEELAVKKKINDIFSSSKFIYKATVLITTKNEGSKKETLVAKLPKGLLTINNKVINYSDIIDIKMI